MVPSTVRQSTDLSVRMRGLTTAEGSFASGGRSDRPERDHAQGKHDQHRNFLPRNALSTKSVRVLGEGAPSRSASHYRGCPAKDTLCAGCRQRFWRRGEPVAVGAGRRLFPRDDSGALASPAGFEPATSSSGDSRSIQLSYGDALSTPECYPAPAEVASGKKGRPPFSGRGSAVKEHR